MRPCHRVKPLATSTKKQSNTRCRMTSTGILSDRYNSSVRWKARWLSPNEPSIVDPHGSRRVTLSTELRGSAKRCAHAASGMLARTLYPWRHLDELRHLR